MNMEFIKSELKKIFRDSMMKFMLAYPLVLALIARFGLPAIADSTGFEIEHFADLVIVILILLTPALFGALLAFSILDDRDDGIFIAIKTTPLSLNHFIIFRLVLFFIMTFVAGVFVVWASDIGNLTFNTLLGVSFLASLGVPMTGLIINMFSSNKIEGFAVMKGINIIVVFPIIALFFLDYKEFFFSFAPGFWPAKAISVAIRGEELFNLSFNQYYIIGLIYVIFLNIMIYRTFIKKQFAQ
mgnify:CR=1 FL=1